MISTHFFRRTINHTLKIGADKHWQTSKTLMYFTETCPVHLALMDEVVTCHPLLHQRVLEVLVKLRNMVGQTNLKLIRFFFPLFSYSFGYSKKSTNRWKFLPSLKSRRCFWTAWSTYSPGVTSYPSSNTSRLAGTKQTRTFHLSGQSSYQNHDYAFCSKRKFFSKCTDVCNQTLSLTCH